MNTRQEKDALGVITLPENAYYGPQTERARQNFIDSGLKLPLIFIRSLAVIKLYAAQTNANLGLLRPEYAKTIAHAAQEVMNGTLDDQFVVDVFQTGSGTSTNMNMNEVIASRANELITGKISGKDPIHPNDHVNMGQSSNDVIPSAIHIAASSSIRENLLPALKILQNSLREKADRFRPVIKIGRTHLQDAVPLTFGDEFGGYARQIELSIKRMQYAVETLQELPLGGTAVGTGLNTHDGFAREVIAKLTDHFKIKFREAENHFEAQGARDAAVETSGILKTVAVSLRKIANDIRWLASGPHGGLGEIGLPALQPGSSIMPGKINPVIPEATIQITAQVIGNDAAITLGGFGGHLELNAMLPLIAYNLLQSIALLASGCGNLAQKCIDGITVRKAVCAEYVEKSFALATFLVPKIGYDQAAMIVEKANATGKSIKETAIDEKVLTRAEWSQLFDLKEHP